MKKPSLVLMGAGGHGKVIADIVEKEGKWEIAGFLDDGAKGTAFGIPVLGGKSIIGTLKKKGITGAIVSIGFGAVRETLQKKFKNAGLELCVAIHPGAAVAREAQLGEGTVVMPGAVVGPNAVIGAGCIVNTCASVDHDCTVGAFTHIAPGAHLAGGVTVGHHSHIGIGSCVKEGVTIGNYVTVGAGSAVLEDLPDNCTAYGVPAKPTKGKSA